jgi:hypothetical protein
MAQPHDFGAAGDGRTDDTAALQHALDSGDGLLELAAVSYRITRPLVVRFGRGYGAVLGKGGASRLIMAGPGPALHLIGEHRGTAQPSSVTESTWRNERFPIISALEIVGAHAQADGLLLQRTLMATVSQVLIRGCRIGIHLVERNRNFILANAHVYDNRQYGLFFDACNLHQAIIHGNHISYNHVAGVRSLGGDVHNVQITGNDIEYNNLPQDKNLPDDSPRSADIWFESLGGAISEITIAGNTIQATVTSGGANVRILGSADPQAAGARLINITGNVIGSQRRGLELDHVIRATITGNSIYDSADLSLRARHCSGLSVGHNTLAWRGNDEAPQADGILLEDCENCVLGGLSAQRLWAGTAERGGAVTLIRCRDVALSNCQLLDSRVRGVELIDCRRCSVAANHIVDRRADPTMREGIRVSGDSRDILLLGNIVGGATQQAIKLPEERGTARENVILS